MSVIFAVLCFAVFTALNYEFVDGSHCIQPAINLDGVASGGSKKQFKANKALAFWDVTSGLTYIEGDMKYSEGVITVPYAGKYFVYCQLYYRVPHFKYPRHEILVNGTIVAEAGSSSDTKYEGSYYAGGRPIQLQANDKLTCQLRWDS